ncbi:conserved Plasmodium protein, unknown function, partial [Plasmodium ovale curtisi]
KLNIENEASKLLDLKTTGNYGVMGLGKDDNLSIANTNIRDGDIQNGEENKIIILKAHNKKYPDLMSGYIFDLEYIQKLIEIYGGTSAYVEVHALNEDQLDAQCGFRHLKKEVMIIENDLDMNINNTEYEYIEKNQIENDKLKSECISYASKSIKHMLSSYNTLTFYKPTQLLNFTFHLFQILSLYSNFSISLKPLNFEASTSLSKINQPLTSGITNTQEQNVNTSTGIGNTSNVPNIVVTGSNENVANINQRTQNPLDVNSLNRFGSNVLSNDQINSSTFHPEVNNLGGRNTGNMINSQNKYGIKNNIFNKCLDCTGYWYSCNCSLNNFEKSTLTLSTQISLLLILCLHPNIDKYVYEKRKNIKINNSLSPDGTNIGVQSSGKEHI